MNNDIPDFAVMSSAELADWLKQEIECNPMLDGCVSSENAVATILTVNADYQKIMDDPELDVDAHAYLADQADRAKRVISLWTFVQDKESAR